MTRVSRRFSRWSLGPPGPPVAAFFRGEGGSCRHKKSGFAPLECLPLLALDGDANALPGVRPFAGQRKQVGNGVRPLGCVVGVPQGKHLALVHLLKSWSLEGVLSRKLTSRAPNCLSLRQLPLIARATRAQSLLRHQSVIEGLGRRMVRSGGIGDHGHSEEPLLRRDTGEVHNNLWSISNYSSDAADFLPRPASALPMPKKREKSTKSRCSECVC